jgi:hypothetical protein
MNYWRGLLDDCSNDDDLEDTVVVVCGFKIDSRGRNDSYAKYGGGLEFVEDNDPNSNIKLDVRPWPDYDRSVEMAKEWEADDVEESAGMKHYKVSPAIIWSSFASFFVFN